MEYFALVLLISKNSLISNRGHKTIMPIFEKPSLFTNDRISNTYKPSDIKRWYGGINRYSRVLYEYYRVVSEMQPC